MGEAAGRRKAACRRRSEAERGRALQPISSAPGPPERASEGNLVGERGRAGTIADPPCGLHAGLW